MSASTIWDNFNDVMQDAIKYYVPCKMNRTNAKKPLWMTGKVLRSDKEETQLM